MVIKQGFVVFGSTRIWSMASSRSILSREEVFYVCTSTGGDFSGEDIPMSTGCGQEGWPQGTAPPQEAVTNLVDLESFEDNQNKKKTQLIRHLSLKLPMHVKFWIVLNLFLL